MENKTWKKGQCRVCNKKDQILPCKGYCSFVYHQYAFITQTGMYTNQSKEYIKEVFERVKKGRVVSQKKYLAKRKKNAKL